MAYTSLAELIKKIDESTLIQLVDDEKLNPATVDAVDAGTTARTGRIDDAITEADALIDTYCGAKYSVPFSSAPQVVQELSATITIYNLYSRRVLKAIPDVRVARYEQALNTLALIAKGTISLGIDPPPTSNDYSETNVSTSPRVFSRTTMEGF